MIVLWLAAAHIAFGHGVGDGRVDKEQYRSQASLINAGRAKDDDFASELADEQKECRQFDGSSDQAREAWKKTMHTQADSILSSRAAWDPYKNWAEQLAPSADQYKQAKDVRTASRKLAVGIGFEQDADTDMEVQSLGYGNLACGQTAALDRAKTALGKGKDDIRAGLAALKTAVDAG
jgi:hypothetical protein